MFTGLSDFYVSKRFNIRSCLLNNRKGSSSKPEENDVEGSSVESTDTSESGIRWCESTHFYLYGQEIIFGQTTVQELYDTGCCCKFWEWDESYTNRLDRTLDDTVDIPGCNLYPDDKAAEANVGAAYILIQAPEGYRRNYPLKEGIIEGITFQTNTASVWGDNISFDIPYDMTPEQLLENSGQPKALENNTYFFHTYNRSISDHEFEFDKLDRLVRFTISKLERIYLIVLSRQLLLFKKSDKAATLSDSE